jgi:eukaryotic-like serine/threonine-protein kinase
VFCQQCGAQAPDQSKFCKQCGHRLRFHISNKALLLAGVAAIVSVGTSLPLFFSGNEPIRAQETPTPLVAIASPSPSPRVSPSPKMTPKPTAEPTLKPEPQRPEPTPDYPYRHTPRLESPADGAVFTHFPRNFALHWIRNAASEAVRYRVTIQYSDPARSFWSTWREIETSGEWHADNFVGAQPGRWRVTPILRNGSLGIPTAWREFRFTQ